MTFGNPIESADSAREQARSEANALRLTLANSRASYPLRFIVCGVVANPESSSDALLILADTLHEAAAFAAANNQIPEARSLAHLAGHLQRLAPRRAGSSGGTRERTETV